MKIECEVTSVKTNGESLIVGLQGAPPTAASWRNLEHQEITIPASKPNQRAFYVGRRVLIVVGAR